MTTRSEGIRRIFLIISILFVIGWLLWIVKMFNDGMHDVTPLGWIIFLAAGVIAYFIPQFIYRISCWVANGFKEDK